MLSAASKFPKFQLPPFLHYRFSCETPFYTWWISSCCEWLTGLGSDAPRLHYVPLKCPRNHKPRSCHSPALTQFQSSLFHRSFAQYRELSSYRLLCRPDKTYGVIHDQYRCQWKPWTIQIVVFNFVITFDLQFTCKMAGWLYPFNFTTGNPLPVRSLTAPRDPSVWYLKHNFITVKILAI